MSQFYNPICFQGNVYRSSITSPGTNRYRKRRQLTAYMPQEVWLRKTDYLKVKTTCESISDTAKRRTHTHTHTEVSVSVVFLQVFFFVCCEMFLIHIAGSRPVVRGGAPITNLDVPTTSLQTPKDKHADNPTKPVTTYCTHAWPLLNHRG